ncbi:MAG: DUF5050 domain-containing protein [Tepidibacter sp.]|jgi:hypothetical protein|uniref:TolB family protein n=1 Tax=Tepidibacter sp. TaxID=2529387 RepID=UPI0025DAE105|nr:DUF5050 domain-containing protein [Tepidibacter sp.]MCT4509724.1 DUF5050 domain-containing protein [Tepidibacter sp.]MCT4584785.1 DUF5050 domain-containing protein [Peptostreptococcaceae bacterium]
MGKKFFTFVTIWLVSISFMLFGEDSFAVEQSVKVRLPKFNVTINENKIDNLHREYPLLLYKDMTYFPMTWYDCRLLGLETKWTQDEGFKIIQSNVTSSYVPYKTKHKNRNSYNATIPTFKITANGNAIYNSKEEYPLLSFNNVTYFPLTWKFAHDTFGWEYDWDKSKGLMIKSNNPQVKTVNLPKYAGENDVAVFNGYYYFVETVDTVNKTNKVYRVKDTNISNKELVYSYEIDTSYGFNNSLTFYKIDKTLWFYYHSGGAVMGEDVYCKVNNDGKATVEESGYLDFKNTSKGTLKIYQGPPLNGPNLFLESKEGGIDKEKRKRIGNQNLTYGWHIQDGYSPDRCTTVINDNVYILASTYPIKDGEQNFIYTIDLDTNETIKITDFGVKNFKIASNKIYYVKDEDKYLYVSNLDGTNEKKLSDNKLEGYEDGYYEVDGNVYYTVSEQDGRMKLYKVVIDKEDKLVLKENLRNIKIENNRLICTLLAEEDYGIKVFNKSGDLNLAITDQVSNSSVDGEKILITSGTDKSIKLVKLKSN